MYLQASILNDRVLNPKPSPEEYLAEQLKAHVQADDDMVVGYYDPTLWLYLDLKLPRNQAPMHLQFRRG